MRSKINHVGVGSHTDGEDHPGDAGQREGHGDGAEQAPEQDAVDDEREVGDEAEETIVGKHVDEHEAEADETGDEALPQGVLAQRGRDLLLVGGLELDRQGAGLEHESKVLRLLDRHVAAADLGAPADAVSQVRLRVVDHRDPIP